MHRNTRTACFPLSAAALLLALAANLAAIPGAAAADLFVSSGNTNSILRYDGTSGAPLGAFVSAGSGGLDSPQGLTFGPDGNLYVSSRDSSGVLRYDGRTGGFKGAFVPSGSGGLNLPHGLTFGADGNLYVSSLNSNQILRYSGIWGGPIDAFVPAG